MLRGVRLTVAKVHLNYTRTDNCTSEKVHLNYIRTDNCTREKAHEAWDILENKVRSSSCNFCCRIHSINMFEVNAGNGSRIFNVGAGSIAPFNRASVLKKKRSTQTTFVVNMSPQPGTSQVL